jgi:Leucine-rich repeat (LRR) protein
MIRLLFLLFIAFASLVSNAQTSFRNIVTQDIDPKEKNVLLTGNLSSFDYTKVASCKEVETLKLIATTNLNLDLLFQQCKTLSELREVDIIGCGISVVPNSIRSLNRIQVLNLRDNLLRGFPDSIAALTSLKVLELSHNSYLYDSDVYDKIKGMKIERLDFSDSGLFGIDEKIGDVKSLLSIDFSGNDIKSLPKSLSQLSLLSVDLSENQHLDTGMVFKQLASQKNLESLRLAQCELSYISEDICALKSLKLLDLSGNVLKMLPQNIGNLSLLEDLNLGMVNLGFRMNLLTSLPTTFSNLTNLKRLDLSSNQLSILPFGMNNLTNLEYLDLKQNQLPDFPSSLTKCNSLRYLNLNGNNLIFIPETVGDLTSLVELRLDNNFFNRFDKKIKLLPESIGKLVNLKILTLRDNVIESLPSSIGNLKNLELLDLRDNLLSSLPESICSMPKLTYLDLKTNELASLPRCFEKMISITDLNLSMNPTLKSEYYMTAILGFPNLKYLDVSYNNLTREQLTPFLNAKPNCKVINKNTRQVEKEKPNQGDFKFEKPAGK